ncbi:MAG: diaminopimelate epimerase [Anaerolineales bacterium]|nr:diaminopimelate epimerase [Anaerolineales bacterium]
MQPVPFTKMSGLGNDFIIVDNRQGILDEIGLNEFAHRVCTRRVSLGGDELMVIEQPAAGGDFSMRTINPDGNEVEMCGNAARCVARYAFAHGIAGASMTIDTRGGPVRAWVDADGAKIQLQITAGPALNLALDVAGEPLTLHQVSISGTPHVVVFRTGVAALPVENISRLGAAIRHHPTFPQGINANFVEVLDAHTLWQRTFERGVDGETLACGTGAAASSVIGACLGLVESPLRLHVLGGELGVSFEYEGGRFKNLFLSGGARFVAEGVLHPEAWRW